MADLHVLDCRIYFTDVGNADNAYAHIKALAEQSAAHDIHVGNESESSWGRLHTCKAETLAGDTSQCVTSAEFVIAPPPEPPEPVVTGAWQPGLSVLVGEHYTYETLTYVVLQAHTTQLGWEPPVTPALWGVV